MPCTGEIQIIQLVNGQSTIEFTAVEIAPGQCRFPNADFNITGVAPVAQARLTPCTEFPAAANIDTVTAYPVLRYKIGVRRIDIIVSIAIKEAGVNEIPGCNIQGLVDFRGNAETSLQSAPRCAIRRSTG